MKLVEERLKRETKLVLKEVLLKRQTPVTKRYWWQINPVIRVIYVNVRLGFFPRHCLTLVFKAIDLLCLGYNMGAGKD